MDQQLMRKVVADNTLNPVRQNLKAKIEEQMFIYNNNRKAPNNWIETIFKDNTGILNNLENYMIEPSVLFFDENLEKQKIDQCNSRIYSSFFYIM